MRADPALKGHTTEGGDPCERGRMVKERPRPSGTYVEGPFVAGVIQLREETLPAGVIQLRGDRRAVPLKWRKCKGTPYPTGTYVAEGGQLVPPLSPGSYN
jgi:hypothetical protein